MYIYGMRLLRFVESADIACSLANGRFEFVTHQGFGLG
jgi:hypothetical protein